MPAECRRYPWFCWRDFRKAESLWCHHLSEAVPNKWRKGYDWPTNHNLLSHDNYQRWIQPCVPHYTPASVKLPMVALFCLKTANHVCDSTPQHFGTWIGKPSHIRSPSFPPKFCFQHFFIPLLSLNTSIIFVLSASLITLLTIWNWATTTKPIKHVTFLPFQHADWSSINTYIVIRKLCGIWISHHGNTWEPHLRIVLLFEHV